MQKLPLSAWQATKVTLHLYLQIIGKIRLTLFPNKNHWWHVTFYLNARGITTGPIPYQHFVFEINFDFIDHKLIINTSNNTSQSFALVNLSVADFYQHVFASLKKLAIDVTILAKPFDATKVGSDIPFAKDQQHKTYDAGYVHRYWQLLVVFYSTFQKFSGRFNGKATPVHIFWHTFDMAYTRFSGRRAPEVADMDPVTKEAYTHEVISFGMWAGDSNISEPSFYSYTYPEPDNLSKQSLKPDKATWIKTNGSHLAILKYHDLINYNNPDQILLDFFESAYQAGAKCANWPISDFTR